MNSVPCTLFARVAALVLLVTTPLQAQHEQHGMHAADAAAQVGSEHIDFRTTCPARVGAEFNRAVALLHSFWFPEAIKAFEAVGAAEPDCALAWWGLSLAHWGNPFGGVRSRETITLGQQSVARARAAVRGDARERGLVEAMALLYADAHAATQPARVRQYEAAMGRLAAAWPDDVELAIFHALAITQSASPDDATYAELLRAAAILDPLFERFPLHPGLAHYIIHTYDVPPLASRGLVAARRYASLAPAVPHALHMPSHTFTRIGSWEESIDTNLRSAEAARASGAIGDELHAMDYLAYAYLQTGRDTAARALAQQVEAVAGSVTAGRPLPNPFALAAIPARLALERGDWAAAARLTLHPGLAPNAAAITHFARAIGAAMDGSPAAADADIAALARLQQQLAAVPDPYWANQVGIQHDVARAVQEFAAGHRAPALERLAEAAARQDRTDKAAVTPGPFAPARELLGELQLAADRPAEALQSFANVLTREPNRFRAVAGAARAAGLAGQPDESRRHYAQLLAIAANADSERGELLAARRALASSWRP